MILSNSSSSTRLAVLAGEVPPEKIRHFTYLRKKFRGFGLEMVDGKPNLFRTKDARLVGKVFGWLLPQCMPYVTFWLWKREKRLAILFQGNKQTNEYFFELIWDNQIYSALTRGMRLLEKMKFSQDNELDQQVPLEDDEE